MGKAFQLEIITPNDPFYKGSAESVILPAIDGEYGVLAGHEPVVTAIEPGTARYLVDGEWKEVVVGQGFAEIMPDYTILLLQRQTVWRTLIKFALNALRNTLRNGCARKRAFMSIIDPRRRWPALWLV